MRIAVALGLAGVMLFGSATWLRAEEPKADAKSATSKASLAAITIKGSLPETAGSAGLFAEMELDLPRLRERLEKAAKDKDVSAVVLRLRDPEVGQGKLTELRSAIANLRKSGKKVYADLQSGMTDDYLLACACDEIVMPESGTLAIPGVRAEITFYKGLFDKLGVEADMLQVGKFKGAAEPYSRTGMSAEFRAQYESVLDDMFEQVVSQIAADRKLDPKRVRELVDQGIFSAKEAKAAGLIDKIAYTDEFEAGLKQTLKADSLNVVKDYGKAKVDTDFSGLAGMMKFMELVSGAEPEKKTSKNKKIAIIYATGMIMPGESSVSFLGEQVLGGETIVTAIREAADDKTVAAIVLRVDSPGGSALASDLMWREIVRCEKPIVCSMGDVAASGGYYIAMGCKKIYAEPGTITGSIGVVGGKVALKGLYDKVGLNTEVISRGRNSGLFSMETRFTDTERAAWKKSMEETYQQFVGKASQGRKLDLAKLETLAEGRVWTGRQAKERGLVDEIGTLDDAIAAAKELGGIKAEEKVDQLILPKPKGFFDQLFGGDSVRTPIRGELNGLVPELGDRLGDAALLGKLFSERSVLVLPYRVRFK